MSGRHPLRAAATVTVVALVFAGCGKSKNKGSSTTTAGQQTTTTTASSNSRGNVDGQLVMGVLLPQTGALSAIVSSMSTPIDMAIEEINAAGGVLGKDVVRKDGDDGTDDPNTAGTSFDKLLTTDKVDTLLGPASSSIAGGLMAKIKSNGVVDCSGSTTAASITSADDGGYYFRTAPPDKFQGPALAQVITNDGHSKIAIIARNDDYGQGFDATLKKSLTTAGATMVADKLYDPKATDFKSDVDAVKAANPDAVIVIGFPTDGGKVIAQMISSGIGPGKVPIYGTDGVQASSFYKAVDASNPAVLVGMKGTVPAAAPAGVVSAFNDAFKAKGIDPIFSSYYYDCTIITALAAIEGGSDDPATIKAHMIDVTKDGTKCTTFKACKDLLDAGKDIDYDGASGPLDFSDAGEPTNGVYDVWAFDAQGKTPNVAGVAQIKISD